MSLKLKLFLLVGGSMLLFSLAAVVFFVIQMPIDQMRRENGTFQRLSLATTELRSELNMLPTSGFETQSKKYREAQTNYNAALDNIAGIVLLPTINDTLKDAVSAVVNLKELSADGLSNVDQNLQDLADDAKDLNQDVSDSFIIINLLRGGSEAASNNIVLFHTSSLLANLTTLNDSLSTIVGVVKAKDEVIAQEITKVQERSTLISIGLVTVLILIAFALALLITRSITVSFGQIDHHIALMGDGDFTVRFASNRRDEIGKLGRNLDNLLEILNLSLSKIKAASRQNLERRNELGNAVSEATSSAVQIEANAASIRGQMETMDGMVAVSTKDMDNIMQILDNFSRAILAQNQHVEESVAAVTEMLASIGNISRITEKDRESADSLVREADRGREVFDSAFERVAEITDSVSAIQQMADVIAGIASQTNILAMNAAIEAAHAGEFGKGFAVVADEISKLAAAAANSSDEIAHTIQTVVLKINEAGSTRQNTIQAFDAISGRIGEVSNSVREIHSNVNEMQTGSRQILEAMQELRHGSARITEESGQVREASATVRNVMGDISRVSHEVVSNIGEIGAGLRDITATIHRVSEQADGIGEIGNNLDEAINVFKTDDRG